jgi:hypothetical protein
MADSSKSPVPRRPSTIDRAALERVLARASQLQASTGDEPDELTEEQLIELGKEVGLSSQHLRQALAEERTRSPVPDDERGIAASLFGPSRVSASRTVVGKPTDVLATIDAWMKNQEMLIVKRHHADRIVWEPRQDFLVGLKRAFKVGGRDYALSHSFETSATVVVVDDTRVHVGLDADFRTARRRSAQSTVTGGIVGAGAAGALLVMGVFAPIAVLPAVFAPGIALAGARGLQGRVVIRAQLALEQLLDRLERGEIGRRGSDNLLSAIVAAATALPPRR